MSRTLGIALPIIQAPMAGVSTVRLAAEVSTSGGLGSIAVGAMDAASAGTMIDALRQQTAKPFNVNLFVHQAPIAAPDVEKAWLELLRPVFEEFGAAPPRQLRAIYASLADDADMLAMLVETRPPIISFHFGVPTPDIVSALRQTGAVLMATATSVAEAQRIEAAGLDFIIAQGIEAGGHRGVFDPREADDAIGTMALVLTLVRTCALPIVAAGGIMDGAGIAAALALGSVAAQLGTAFIACPESSADDAYRAALMGPAAYHTTLTSLISGRPARALANRFTALAADAGLAGQVPDYPLAYDAGQALHAAAKTRGEHGFGAHWAGQGAPLARVMPAAALMATLVEELAAVTNGQTLHRPGGA